MKIAFIAVLAVLAHGAIINFEEQGGILGDDSIDACNNNTELINHIFGQLKPGDTFLLPNKTFHFNGGIKGNDLKDVVLQIDGTLSFSTHKKEWPYDSTGRVIECMMFERLHNVTFTSSGKGTLDGNGKVWWGAIKYLEHQENRPRLVHIHNSTNLLVEHLLLKNSPYWTFLAQDIADLVIRYTDVDARWDNADYHDLFDLTAFNTDGFDVAGKNVHIYDCNIWNDDDCIAVKEMNGDGFNAKCSENMLFERINASGVGLTIGSIGASTAHTCVRNITFRNSEMHDTFKGIYMKSRPSGDGTTGEITNVLYHNISIFRPTQWPIWIGPQQAGYKGACSLLWPTLPFTHCPVPPQMTWTNITLKDIYIEDPKMSPGVILGNNSNPMNGIVFDNVTVVNPGSHPWGNQFYKCDGVINSYATASTQPVPPCFNTTAPGQ